MNQRVKKILAVLLNLIIIFSCFQASVVSGTAEEESYSKVLYDFEYVTGEENKGAENYIPSFTIPTRSATWLNNNSTNNTQESAVLAEAGYPLYMWPNDSLADADNTTATATVVSAADGEPVRFGEHALKIHLDYSSYDYRKNANFYLRVTEPDYAFEGSPTAIGCWVYVPEGTTNYILFLNCANECDDPENGFNTSYQLLGKIDWVGWKYLEFDLTGTKTDAEGNSLGGQKVGGSYEPFGFYQGCGVFWISYRLASMGRATEDTIYIDNITLIYGESDPYVPQITSIKADDTEIINNTTVVKTNSFVLSAEFTDETVKDDCVIANMFIDNVNVTDNCEIEDDVIRYQADLSEGIHTVEVIVTDLVGNMDTEKRTFAVTYVENDDITSPEDSENTVPDTGEDNNGEADSKESNFMQKFMDFFKRIKDFFAKIISFFTSFSE